jgi:hypothetical protein
MNADGRKIEYCCPVCLASVYALDTPRGVWRPAELIDLWTRSGRIGAPQPRGAGRSFCTRRVFCLLSRKSLAKVLVTNVH